jgi:hypothetical protein
LNALLARHGSIVMQREHFWELPLFEELFMLHDDFEKLPLYFRLGCIPVMTGMPPFGYWEKPTRGGRIPQHRTDSGVFLTAEALGVKRAICRISSSSASCSSTSSARVSARSCRSSTAWSPATSRAP